MSRRLAPTVTLLSLATLSAAPTPATRASGRPLVVHEWGTFTSVAGADGRAVEWRPLDRPTDLPCFVNRQRFMIKGSLPAKIRMETPVLYFYAPDEITVDVTVKFHQGAVTEWFPPAAVTPESVEGSRFRRADFSSRIAWSRVKVSPGATPDFPVDGRVIAQAAGNVARIIGPAGPAECGGVKGLHYYVARQTDASPLQSGAEKEKFLFYRGVGSFEPPVRATAAKDGRVIVDSPGGDAIGDAIVFENAGGAIAYEIQYGIGRQFVFDPPAHDGEIPPPHRELEQILIAHGLYPKEARAMIETWRDSWFDEGRRLFYIVSRKTIDSILPLDIEPKPTEIVRVFVGRIELALSQ